MAASGSCSCCAKNLARETAARAVSRNPRRRRHSRQSIRVYGRPPASRKGRRRFVLIFHSRVRVMATATCLITAEEVRECPIWRADGIGTRRGDSNDHAVSASWSNRRPDWSDHRPIQQYVTERKNKKKKKKKKNPLSKKKNKKKNGLLSSAEASGRRATASPARWSRWPPSAALRGRSSGGHPHGEGGENRSAMSPIAQPLSTIAEPAHRLTSTGCPLRADSARASSTGIAS